jgi:hypothetical protein
VTIAREAAKKLGVRVEFAHGTIDDCDASNAEGIYLFNPFAENLSPRDERLDESVELSEDRFARDITSMQRLLADAKEGTRVVTYCGWGGVMPSEFRLISRQARTGPLELWVKS